MPRSHRAYAVLLGSALVAAPAAVAAAPAAADHTDLPARVTLMVDCVDQVVAKAALIVAARAAGVAIVTCGAAGGRLDPTRIRCEDLGRLAGDPLLAKVRHKLRREHGFPRHTGKRPERFGVLGVYSDEPLQRPAPVCDAEGRPAAGAALACAGYGSGVVVTATMGFVAASRALDSLCTAARSAR